MVQKAQKMSAIVSKFSKFFGGACPRTPSLELVLLLNLLQTKFVGKMRLKMSKFGAPQKNSEHDLDMKHF